MTRLWQPQPRPIAPARMLRAGVLRPHILENDLRVVDTGALAPSASIDRTDPSRSRLLWSLRADA